MPAPVLPWSGEDGAARERRGERRTRDDRRRRAERGWKSRGDPTNNGTRRGGGRTAAVNASICVDAVGIGIASLPMKFAPMFRDATSSSTQLSMMTPCLEARKRDAGRVGRQRRDGVSSEGGGREGNPIRARRRDAGGRRRYATARAPIRGLVIAQSDPGPASARPFLLVHAHDVESALRRTRRARED
jgi:hypothetical protein